MPFILKMVYNFNFFFLGYSAASSLPHTQLDTVVSPWRTLIGPKEELAPRSCQDMLLMEGLPEIGRQQRRQLRQLESLALYTNIWLGVNKSQ